jgi:hypothetical protein
MIVYSHQDPIVIKVGKTFVFPFVSFFFLLIMFTHFVTLLWHFFSFHVHSIHACYACLHAHFAPLCDNVDFFMCSLLFFHGKFFLSILALFIFHGEFSL